MANCVGNICAKNRQNPLILFKVIIDNVGARGPLFENSVYVTGTGDLDLSFH